MGCPDVHGLVQVRNHEMGSGSIPADQLISTDAIALVRFGLRAPDDPRMLDTIAVIDRLLKVELPQGPGWRRYNLDGYGEKAEAASRNAKSMIERLTLTMNRARQAAITKELMEIIGGAEALKSA